MEGVPAFVAVRLIVAPTVGAASVKLATVMEPSKRPLLRVALTDADTFSLA
jgi:hypothetical protein